jgi:hypothetical protein
MAAVKLSKVFRVSTNSAQFVRMTCKREVCSFGEAIKHFLSAQIRGGGNRPAKSAMKARRRQKLIPQMLSEREPVFVQSR